MDKRGETSSSKDFLGLLQDSARRGTLLSSCEVEVQELMHQLDLHITARCTRWEEEVDRLTDQLHSSRQQVVDLQDALCMKTSQIDELKNKSCQSELEYQAKMADCEAQLLQLSSSLTRINTKYAELRQKRYSRGERGNPPKRHIKAALEHGRETKVTSTTQPKCDSSSHQQDRVTSRRCTEEQRTVQDKASTRTLRLNHLGASGAPQSTVQAARKGSHVTTGSRKASKRSPTVREKQVLVHTAQRKETRGTRDVGTACVHDMDKTSDAERDKEDCANRRGWQEVGKGEEEAGVVRTEERRRECRTKPSSSELVDKLIEEHMKLLNQDLLQVIKSGN